MTVLHCYKRMLKAPSLVAAEQNCRDSQEQSHSHSVPDALSMHGGTPGARVLSPVNNGEPVRPVAFLPKSSPAHSLGSPQSQRNSHGLVHTRPLVETSFWMRPPPSTDSVPCPVSGTGDAEGPPASGLSAPAEGKDTHPAPPTGPSESLPCR